MGLRLSLSSRLSLQLNHSRQRCDDQPRERISGLAATLRASGRAQLMLSVQRSEGGLWGAADTSSVLSFVYAFDRSSFGANVRHDAGGTGYGLDARRSRQRDINLQHSAAYDSARVQLEYQDAYGRYALQVDRFGDDSGIGLLASGALVAIGGHLRATSPLESGFALVRMKGIAGVPVPRENVEAVAGAGGGSGGHRADQSAGLWCR